MQVAVWNKLIPDLIESYNVSSNKLNNVYSDDLIYTIDDDHGAATNDMFRDTEKETGFINLAERNDDDTDMFYLDNNLPVSIIVIVGLILLMFNLLACAGVYYQKQKVKRRELNLERRIKRMSDAGFVVQDESGDTHQSGLIVDSNVERDTRAEAHYDTSLQPPTKRPHFQLRSNSVRSNGVASGAEQQGKIVLKSALKKSGNTSAEMLTDNQCLLYSDQTFMDAAYPRQSKSIPNINHLSSDTPGPGDSSSNNDNSLSRMTRDKHLSKSSNYLEKEKRRGPDELVLYDSMPSPPDTLERKGSGGGKLTCLANSLLRGSGIKKDGRAPSPIIEMVPTSTSAPSTYNFPSRHLSNGGEPIYTSRPLLHPQHRPPPPGPVATPYGIAYPVYNHTGSLPRPMYPPGPPHEGYISMMPRSGLTTPDSRPGLHLPLGPDSPHLATLTKRPELMRHPGPRPTWTGSLVRDGSSIYASRPPLSRMNSLDSSSSHVQFSRPAPDLLPVRMTNATSQTPQAQVKPPVSVSPPAQSPGSTSSSIVSPVSSSSPSSIYGLTRQPSTHQQVASSNQKNISPTNGVNNNNKSKNNPFESESTPESEQVKDRKPSQVTTTTCSSPATTMSQNKVSSTAATTTLTTTSPTTPKSSSPPASAGSKEGSDEPVMPPQMEDIPAKTPVLRKLGEKTPPNTLKRDRDQSSCKSWYSQYSQGFLSKTIDTPDIELPPLGDEDDDETDPTTDEDSVESPNNERKIVSSQS